MSAIILASGSAARKTMLQNVGLCFEVRPGDIDEAAILQKLLQLNKGDEEIALTLACEKALAGDRGEEQALVIGSDQILILEGEILSKAKTSEEAKEKLKMLRGKTHTLIASVGIVRNKEVIWSHAESATLKMHNFNDEFLEKYCMQAKDILTKCVGAYAIEGSGAWLFDTVRGDYFTILGMPLLPLLGFLRQEGQVRFE